MNMFGIILAFMQMPAAHTLNSIDDLLNEVSHKSSGDSDVGDIVMLATFFVMLVILSMY